MRFIRYLILGLIFFYLQILVAPRLVIFGISPFFILPYIVFAGINLNLIQSASITFIIGIALGLLNPYMLGVHSVILLLLTFIIYNYHLMIKKDRPGPVLISLILINFLYLFPLLLMRFIIYGYSSVWLTHFIPEFVYNYIITAILLTVLIIMQKLRIVVKD